MTFGVGGIKASASDAGVWGEVDEHGVSCWVESSWGIWTTHSGHQGGQTAPTWEHTHAWQPSLDVQRTKWTQLYSVCCHTQTTSLVFFFISANGFYCPTIGGSYAFCLWFFLVLSLTAHRLWWRGCQSSIRGSPLCPERGGSALWWSLENVSTRYTPGEERSCPAIQEKRGSQECPPSLEPPRKPLTHTHTHRGSCT